MKWTVGVVGICALLGWQARAQSDAAPNGGTKMRAAPQRIVSLAPSVTEIVFALGEGKKLVGVTRYCDRPIEAKRLPKVGGFSDPSLEAVMALRPDLVIAVPAEANRKVVERIVDLGVRAVVVPDTTLADVEKSIGLIGEALDAGARAQEIIATMRGRISDVEQRVKDRAKPKVLILYDHRPLVVAGPGSFADEVLRAAGGVNAVSRGKVPYPTLSMETVASIAPDVIIDASMGAKDEKATLDAVHMFDRFPSIPAVKNGRVIVVPGDTLMRPGPAIGEDVMRMATMLHPEAFGVGRPAQ